MTLHYILTFNITIQNKTSQSSRVYQDQHENTRQQTVAEVTGLLKLYVYS